ncbi:substrate-binding domain-containing protein [Kitasatospora sp. NPDC006697]|uniref:substrate-binding domain-containing protein n=1 Tax=Kitasatospora sp. NPDC006697 TaxID=3364020 RepID=UPI0036A26263
MRTAGKLFAALAIAASLTTVAAGSALADPPSGVTPASTDIVGVGSDTTQAVLDQFSTDYNTFLGTSTAPHLYSWDATGSSPITTKSGATSIARPNGSSAGITALNNYTNATVNFARSSRGPQASTPTVPGDPSSDDFVAFAKDGVSWSALSGGNAPANLTTADLLAIYTCSKTNWNQITDIPGYTGPNATIDAYLPQLSSGTRSFFLKAINGGSTAATPGTCVESYLPEENEGTDSVFASDANAVFPYSAAHYIGQVYGGHHTSSSDYPGSLTLRNINGVNPISTTNTLNPSFTRTAYGRLVYNVVRDSEWTANGGSNALQNIFGTSGWICTNTTAAADITSYGFQTLPAGACGGVSHT